MVANLLQILIDIKSNYEFTQNKPKSISPKSEKQSGWCKTILGMQTGSSVLFQKFFGLSTTISIGPVHYLCTVKHYCKLALHGTGVNKEEIKRLVETVAWTGDLEFMTHVPCGVQIQDSSKDFL